MKRLSLAAALVLMVFGAGAAFSQQENRKLEIISKPIPAYTEQARRKGVNGRVHLKVEFKPDGTIGEVVCVNDTIDRDRLDEVGLVKVSVDAARKIKFKAQVKDGQPVTVIKLISYSFHTY